MRDSIKSKILEGREEGEKGGRRGFSLAPLD